ncbi:D-galactarate dehydratase [Yoonia sp. 208BN28-4]|uniref:D-galactarate dehydratase n=1 Tax=Yoonia sp. 208BN28-4 TaxID=3126505 RepID=UPI0030A2438B
MNKTLFIPAFALPLLAACDDPLFAVQQPTPPDGAVVEAVVDAPVETLDPTPPPPPPPTARTVEEFDTTSAEDRAEAVAVDPQPAGEQRLGTTNVSLGSAADPGIWLKTGLVSALAPGRVVYPANGNTVNLELRPSGNAASAASQMSLAAMRLLEIPLTALADVEVFRRPASAAPAEEPVATADAGDVADDNS